DMMVGEAVLAVHSNDLSVAEEWLSKVGKRSSHRVLLAFQDWPASVPLPETLKHRLTLTPLSDQTPQTPSDAHQLFLEQRWESLVKTLSSKAFSPEQFFWLGCALAQLARFDDAIPPLERARQEPRLKLESDYWLSLCYARRVEELT